MKIKNVICELKSGASAYSSAYKLIRSLYPAFTFSFIGVSILFILASVLGALLPYLLKRQRRRILSLKGYYLHFS